ncbi:MAG: hypothetical protein ACRDI0_06410 [Actinomycetota bacterium]
MRKSPRVLVMLAGAVAFALSGLPGASATHNADVHTPNMAYEGTSVKNDITNSDLAFWGNRAYAGNYAGFRIIDITDPTDIENPANVITDFSCPGPQNDISVWDSDGDGTADLLFLSVDSPRTDDSCASGATTASNVDSWEGVRIFDISNELAPVQIAAVPTDCGSHTHTLVPGDDGNVYLYVSSYPLGTAAVTTSLAARNDVVVDGVQIDFPAGVRNDGTECLEPEAGEAKQNGIHNKISIIRVPEADPASAGDRTPNDPDGPGGNDPIGWTYPNVKEVALDGGTYWTHRPSGGRVFDFTACHDIAVFMEINRAAGACWAEGHIWDISSPFSPHFLRRFRHDKVSDLFHSATFSWDGKIMAFEDESGGGGADRCHLENGETDEQGAMYFYTLTGDLLGTFKIPMDIPGPCTAHNYNVVPVTDGRYILSSAWYTGGTWMVDFTDPSEPVDVGHYIANTAPNGVGDPISSDVWSSYWYNGYVYANDGLQRGDAIQERGLDVFSFNSPKVATAIDLDFLNPQTQMELIPQTPVVPRCFGLNATIVGTKDADELDGTALADVIVLKGGHDTSNGKGGNDRMCGGAGRDELSGGKGKDRLKGGKGADILEGGPGNDTLIGGPGVDLCIGGKGKKDKAKGCEFMKGIEIVLD